MSAHVVIVFVVASSEVFAISDIWLVMIERAIVFLKIRYFSQEKFVWNLRRQKFLKLNKKCFLVDKNRFSMLVFRFN